jgi:hypothetical protein
VKRIFAATTLQSPCHLISWASSTRRPRDQTNSYWTVTQGPSPLNLEAGSLGTLLPLNRRLRRLLLLQPYRHPGSTARPPCTGTTAPRRWPFGKAASRSTTPAPARPLRPRQLRRRLTRLLFPIGSAGLLLPIPSATHRSVILPLPIWFRGRVLCLLPECAEVDFEGFVTQEGHIVSDRTSLVICSTSWLFCAAPQTVRLLPSAVLPVNGVRLDSIYVFLRCSVFFLFWVLGD